MFKPNVVWVVVDFLLLFQILTFFAHLQRVEIMSVFTWGGWFELKVYIIVRVWRFSWDACEQISVFWHGYSEMWFLHFVLVQNKEYPHCLINSTIQRALRKTHNTDHPKNEIYHLSSSHYHTLEKTATLSCKTSHTISWPPKNNACIDTVISHKRKLKNYINTIGKTNNHKQIRGIYS